MPNKKTAKKTPKKSSGSPEISSGDMPPVKLDPAAAEPALKQSAQQRGQDDDEQGSGSGSDQEFSFGSIHEAEANTLVDRVEQMHAQQFGKLPGDQLHVSAEVREAFVKIHPVLKTARHDDEAAMAILELLIKKSPKKTPKKPSVLPDDSSGSTSPIGADSAAEPSLKQTVTFIRKSPCRFGESCQYQYLHSGYDASNFIKSHERPAKSESKFPSILSPAEMFKSKMDGLQACLGGASKKLNHNNKIGGVFTYVEIPGRDAHGGSWQLFNLVDEKPDLPCIAGDVSLLREVSVLRQKDLGQIPIPRSHLSLVLMSLVSGQEPSSRGGEGSAKGCSGSKGFKYNGSSFLSSYGKVNSGRGNGYPAYSRGGDRGESSSFLSSAEPPLPPTNWFQGSSFLSAAEPPLPPPPFVRGPDPQQGHVNASQQDRHMFLSQPSPAAMGANGSQSHIHDPPYSDGSSDRMQPYAPDRSPYAPQGAPFDETSGKSFWSHGSQYNGSKDGKGGSWFGGPQYQGAGVPGKGGPHEGGWNFSC